MTPELTISIIAPGRLGGTLACVAAAGGYSICALGARRQSPAGLELAEAVSAELLPPTQAACRADVVFICCGDDAIRTLCEAVASDGGFRKDQFVIHCSGVLDSGILAAAEACGALTGSFHPLQTFPDLRSGLARWAGTHCFIETKYPQVRDFLHRFAMKTQAVPHDIESSRKALYHAACVMCCNHMTALEDSAMRVFEAAGIPYNEALQAAGPIMRATLENILEKSPAGALTGPVARGDSETVRKHLDALAEMPAEEEVYRALCRAAVTLARRGGLINDEKAIIFEELLKEGRIDG